MLHEGDRLIKPVDILEQVKQSAHHFDAVVVLGLGKPGEANEIWMSTLTINELAMLAQAFQAEMVIRMGAMREGR
jgi:hypothetical protein